MTYEEGDKIIAVFMNDGYWQVWRKGFYKPSYSDKYKSKSGCERAIKSMNHLSLETHEAKFVPPDYHSSWEMLMESVARIEKLKSVSVTVTIAGYLCTIEQTIRATKDGLHDKILASTKNSNKREAVWEAVVRFVEWYNSTHNAHGELLMYID